MAAAQRGDAGAYRRLLDDVSRLVEVFLRSRVVDPDDRRDLVQDTLTLMHRARHTYDPVRPFEPWLFAITRNALIDHRRRQTRRRNWEVPADEAPEPAGDLAADERRLLETALARLPHHQRQAVELLKLDGLSVEAAAARAGVSGGTLRVRAHRAYQALRAMLGGER